MVVLFLSQPAAAQPGPDQKTIAEQAATWKTVIGKRYEVARPIEVHGSPSSRDTRDVAPGRTFTVTGLLSDPTDPSTAAYAIRLDSGGRVYIEVRDFQVLIHRGSVVRTDKVPEGQKKGSIFTMQVSARPKEQPRETPLEVGNLPRTYRTLAHHVSFHVSEALCGVTLTCRWCCWWRELYSVSCELSGT